jgi:TetR/AcrR family transcriptional regulator, transcriptional repressor for nem operon
MARTREFDYDRAIQRATRVFWKKGYSNASLRELLKAMGIGEGSFYRAVKGKKDLFVRCLAHYNDTVSRRRLAALDSGRTAREGVRAFFRLVLDELDDPTTPRICLLAGSLSADVLGDRDLKKIVVHEMTTFGDRFTRRLSDGKARGEFPAAFDPVATSQVLVGYLQGLFRIIGTVHSRAQVEKQLETLLTGLGL